MSKLKYGIVGYPVKHSLSPVMQEAAFRAFGIDATYGLHEVEPAGLAEFLESAAGNGFAGFNVTIPHKLETKKNIEQNGALDESASRLGAVNTVKVSEGGKLHGYNTDGAGFYRSLVEDLSFEPEGRKVFILGAGGAASAITMYLGNGPRAVYVYDMDESRVARLGKLFASRYDSKHFIAVSTKDIAAIMKECDLLINATPVGMKDADPLPVDRSLLRGGIRVYDLVYNRPETRLVYEARKLKAHACTGMGMLLYQGAIAFEIWTGLKAPVAVMKKALKEAIKKSSV